MRSARHTLIRYTLFQIPDLILLGLALAAAVHWWELSNAVAYTLFGLWVLKDIFLYPLMRVAYEPGNGANDWLTGAVGLAREALDPTGYVMVGSELWNAQVAIGDEVIAAGTAIRVVRLEGLMLLVEAVVGAVVEPVEEPLVEPGEAKAPPALTG